MEDGACCDRVSLNFGAGGGSRVVCRLIQLGGATETRLNH